MRERQSCEWSGVDLVVVGVCDLDPMSPRQQPAAQKTVQGSPLHKSTQGTLKPKTRSKLWRLHCAVAIRYFAIYPLNYKPPSTLNLRVLVLRLLRAQRILSTVAALEPEYTTGRVPDSACSADETASWNLQT